MSGLLSRQMKNISRKSLNRLTQVYYLVWTGLAVVATVYLATEFLGAKTHNDTKKIATTASPTKIRMEDEFAIPAKAALPRTKLDPVVAESPDKKQALQEDLAAIRKDMNSLKQRLGLMEKSGDNISKKVTLLEENLTITTASLKTGSTKNQAEISGTVIPETGVIFPGETTVTVAPPYPTKTKSNVKVSYKPMPEEGFGDQTEPETLPSTIVTGSPTQTLFGLYLGSGRNVDEVRAHWIDMKSLHGFYFSKLEARIVHNRASSERPYRLIAGPFTNAEDAVKLCAQLRGKAIGCKQTHFAGKPL